MNTHTHIRTYIYIIYVICNKKYNKNSLNLNIKYI